MADYSSFKKWMVHIIVYPVIYIYIYIYANVFTNMPSLSCV